MWNNKHLQLSQLLLVVNCLVFALGCPSGGGGGGGGAPKTELEGTWDLTTLILPGLDSSRVTFTGSRWSSEMQQTDLDTNESTTSTGAGTFTINTETTPKQIDLTTTEVDGESVEELSTSYSIYSIVDGQTLNIGAGGTDPDSRPASFDAGTVVFRYERVSSKSNTAELLDAVISLLDEDQ